MCSEAVPGTVPGTLAVIIMYLETVKYFVLCAMLPHPLLLAFHLTRNSVENPTWPQNPMYPHSGESCPQVKLKRSPLFSQLWQGSLTLSSVNTLFVFLLLFLFAFGKVH